MSIVSTQNKRQLIYYDISTSDADGVLYHFFTYSCIGGEDIFTPQSRDLNYREATRMYPPELYSWIRLSKRLRSS